ncbi:Protein of unknown function [Cotesia congregata]|uniref:Uncharacterized protein n=1 Tax=Cotesia congregata TaxID=51543 RepID=A0A8J2MB80_COTCN|nr:Protein of unknown function [Cotesia congregata]
MNSANSTAGVAFACGLRPRWETVLDLRGGLYGEERTGCRPNRRGLELLLGRYLHRRYKQGSSSLSSIKYYKNKNKNRTGTRVKVIVHLGEEIAETKRRNKYGNNVQEYLFLGGKKSSEKKWEDEEIVVSALAGEDVIVELKLNPEDSRDPQHFLLT